MSRSERIGVKLDAIFWWLIWLLPLIGVIVALAFGGDNTFSEFSTFIEGFSFPFVRNVISDVETTVSITFPAVLTAYASYLVSVEIVHVLVDVLVFIPRFAHKLVDVDTYTRRCR